MQITGVYRNSEDVARLQLRELLSRRERDLEALSRAARATFTRRVGRAAGGAAAILAAAVMVYRTIANDGEGATVALLSGGFAAAAGYFLARILAAAHLERSLQAAIFRTGADVWSDLERLERTAPSEIVRRLCARVEQASVALPLIALSLLVPLTLHYLVWQVGGGGPMSDFDEWIAISAVLVGHCHLLLAALSWGYARKLSRRSTIELMMAPRTDGWAALGIIVAMSCVPGIALLFVPVVLVAATGALFIPVMYWWMAVRLERERLTLHVEPDPVECVS